MNTTTTDLTTAALFAAGQDAFDMLRRSDAPRTVAVREFLAAGSSDDADEAIAAWGVGFLRRALRIAALSWDKDEEVANVFWTLRDSVTDDGFVDFDNDEVSDAA